MPVAKKDNKGDINPYEANWVKIAPRPEWYRPDYWKECHGLVPSRVES